jgi:hypothetical protein
MDLSAVSGNIPRATSRKSRGSVILFGVSQDLEGTNCAMTDGMKRLSAKRVAVPALGGIAALAGVAAIAYAAYVGAAWLRYGRLPAPAPKNTDSLLDQFMPKYEVLEGHRVDVAAPADVTYAALMDLDLEDSRVIRAIFKGRELLLGADAGAETRPRGLIAMTKDLGWRMLAEVPGHQIVMGAVTQPWKANVVFRGLPADQFAAFNEPDYVKIVWTLRSDAVSSGQSIARTETRVVAMSPDASSKFRWYWARFSPGILLIRQMSLRLVKKDAEDRAKLPGDRRR